MRFAGVSSQAEYRELILDPSVTSAWHFDHSDGIDPADREVFRVRLPGVSVHGARPNAGRLSSLGRSRLGPGLAGRSDDDG